MPERTYIVDVILSEFLGLKYRLEIKSKLRDYEINLANGNSLSVRDHFFSRVDGRYLAVENIPDRCLKVTNRYCLRGDISVIYGDAEFSESDDRIVCGIDIFASSFFMLTRWEEYVMRTRDMHGRFPASASLAFREGFLDRAVVNEYVEMLWNMLQRLGCGQERKKREFRTIVSHDIDAPFLFGLRDFAAAIRSFGGDIIKRRDPIAAVRNITAWSRVKMGERGVDPYDTFNFIMDTSEHSGLRSTFFLMTDKSDPSFDSDYHVDHPLIRKTLRQIHERGHEIGLHLSYGSPTDPIRVAKEYAILKAALEGERIPSNGIGSRQHYLRWETPETFGALDESDITYDSTLTYADFAGFRCGVCYEYPVFHVLKRRRLNLRERPLLVMECTVIEDHYMGLGTGDEALTFIKGIKDICRRYKGDFTLLWHNTRLADERERDLYLSALNA